MNFKFWRFITLKDNRTAVERATSGLAEFFGTAMLMFLGCMGAVQHDNERPRELLETALAFGFAVLMAIQCFGNISGAHINPIITFAAFLTGNIPFMEVPIYWIGQNLGSLAGFGIVTLLIPQSRIFAGSEEGTCAGGISSDITEYQALCVEIIISFILVTIACSIVDKRNTFSNDTTAILFGFSVAVIVIAAGPYTGAHMNPARTLGPAILNGSWKKNYWLVISSVNVYGTEITQEKPGVCSTRVNTSLSDWQNLSVEFTVSFLLVIVVCAIWDNRNRYKVNSIPLRFGFSLVGLSIAAGPFTGTHMNPARTLAPTVLNNYWEKQYLYWGGQLSAAILGSLTYIILFGENHENKSDALEEDQDIA